MAEMYAEIPHVILQTKIFYYITFLNFIFKYYCKLVIIVIVKWRTYQFYIRNINILFFIKKVNEDKEIIEKEIIDNINKKFNII